MTRPAILDRLRGVQRSGNGWVAFCPAHEDRAKRSLSISVAEDGKTLLHCFVGCAAETVAGAVDMRMADLAGMATENDHRQERRREVAHYDYRDERGTLLYQVVRFEPKDFRCRRPDGRGGWVWNLAGARIVPYRLVELAEQPRVYLFEGEKDCDALAALGLAATTNHGGAGKWRQEHTDALVAATVPEVVIVPDNDEPGEMHAQAVARACLTAGMRVKLLHLPGLPSRRPKHGEDISDWLAAGHDAAELLALADAAPVYGAAKDTTLIITVATIDEVLAVDPSTLKTDYIVNPYISRGGLGAISAKHGVGKTKLVQDLCVARASGGSWLGLAVEAGPALFWSGEQGRREDFRVLQAFCRGRGIQADAFVHYLGIISDPALRFGHPLMLARVLELARTYPGLFIGIDSIRRAFEGEDSASNVADEFFRTVLIPLRAAGATVLLLAHPPKTSGNLKRIEDDNMIRGSGDFAAQLDGFMVLRPITRKRTGPDSEDIVSRLTHPKARSGRQADPRLVTLHVTHDDSAEITFTLSAAQVTEAEELEGALKAAGLLAEEVKRFSRAGLIKALAPLQLGRKAVEAAIDKLVDLGVIRGPLDKTERLTGERGHWYVFVKPLALVPAASADPEGADEDPDDL